jgi:UDP-N-acetylglucosamine 2-epimerase
MRVLSVVGNRPEFVKSAPLSAALADAGIDEIVVHTGQHYDPELSDVFFRELGLGAPRYHFDWKGTDMGAVRAGVREAVLAEEPDWVVVFGDTSSTLVAAEGAGEVPIAHVEAGLRSFDLSMPEEHIRVAVDAMSALLLCPDDRSAAQLREEKAAGRIEVVGDVMADASRLFAPLARERSDVLDRLGLEPGGYAVATVHRVANVTDDGRLRRIVEGLRRVEGPLVFPAHPRTRASLARLGLDLPTILPLGYLDFAALASQARVVLTDSGGLQKEAYWYRVPCVTLRPNTEWVDTVEQGGNVLVDDDPGAIAAAAAAARFPEHAPQLYGDGYAGRRIAEALYPVTP